MANQMKTNALMALDSSASDSSAQDGGDMPLDELRFIHYRPQKAEPLRQSFFASLKGAAGRHEMEVLALNFAEGASPWEGRLVVDVDTHTDTGNISLLAELGEMIRLPGGEEIELAQVRQWIARRVVPGLLDEGDYVLDVERVWESYFAVSIAGNFNPALLPRLGMLLVAAHLLTCFIARPAAMPAPDQAMLRELVRAVIVLPEDVFPLPPVDSQAAG